MSGIPTPRSQWHSPSGAIYPLVDAEEAILATVIQEDSAGATQGDPCNCAIACSYRRAVGSPEVMIGRDKAYVVVKRGGRWIALRFKVPRETRDALDEFDRTGEMPGGVLRLIPPAASERLDSKRGEAKRRRLRWAVAGRTRKEGGSRPKPRTTVRNASALATTMVVKRWEQD